MGSSSSFIDSNQKSLKMAVAVAVAVAVVVAVVKPCRKR